VAEGGRPRRRVPVADDLEVPEPVPRREHVEDRALGVGGPRLLRRGYGTGGGQHHGPRDHIGDGALGEGEAPRREPTPTGRRGTRCSGSGRDLTVGFVKDRHAPATGLEAAWCTAGDATTSGFVAHQVATGWMRCRGARRRGPAWARTRRRCTRPRWPRYG